MDDLLAGDVIFVPFPFSDLTDQKKRPAVVLKRLNGVDVILCPVTKVKPAEGSEPFLELKHDNFTSGGLRINPSYARPSRLFTAHSGIILFKVGTLTDSTFKELRKQASEIF